MANIAVEKRARRMLADWKRVHARADGVYRAVMALALSYMDEDSDEFLDATSMIHVNRLAFLLGLDCPPLSMMTRAVPDYHLWILCMDAMDEFGGDWHLQTTLRLSEYGYCSWLVGNYYAGHIVPHDVSHVMRLRNDAGYDAESREVGRMCSVGYLNTLASADRLLSLPSD